MISIKIWSFQRYLTLSCILGALFLTAHGEAQESGNPVLAIVNDKAYAESDVRARLGPILSQPGITLENQYSNLLEQFIFEELLNQSAAKAGYLDDPRVQEQIKRATFSFMNQFYYEDQIADQMTEEALMDAYLQRIKTEPQGEEIRARHILLKTEEEAQTLITELNAGADFAELAREHSTGPSGASGGDLGYFLKGQMVPEFEVAAYALEKGAFTQEPVKTQFGYHLILLEDRRQKPVPSFEQLRGEIIQQKRNEETMKLVEKLNNSATVQRFDLLGDPITLPEQENK